MFSFIISVVALFVGYMIYSRVAERVFGPDDRISRSMSTLIILSSESCIL